MIRPGVHGALSQPLLVLSPTSIKGCWSQDQQRQIKIVTPEGSLRLCQILKQVWTASLSMTTMYSMYCSVTLNLFQGLRSILGYTFLFKDSLRE